MNYKPVAFQNTDEVDQQPRGRPLRRLTTDASGLYSSRLDAHETRTITSSCPRSSPRSRSARWSARATTSGSTSSNGCCFALINAEELGVTQANVDQMKDVGQSGDQAPARQPKASSARASGSPTTGPTTSSSCRQLRRDLRAQYRLRLKAADRARSERSLDEGRHPVRAAGPLSGFILDGGLEFAGPSSSLK